MKLFSFQGEFPTPKDEAKVRKLIDQDKKEQQGTNISVPDSVGILEPWELIDSNYSQGDGYGEKLPLNPDVCDGLSLEDHNKYYGEDDYDDSLTMDKRVKKLLQHINRKEEAKKYAKARWLLLALASVVVIGAAYEAAHNLDDIKDKALEKHDDDYYTIHVGENPTPEVVSGIIKKYNADENKVIIDETGIVKVPKRKVKRRIY